MNRRTTMVTIATLALLAGCGGSPAATPSSVPKFTWGEPSGEPSAAATPGRVVACPATDAGAQAIPGGLPKTSLPCMDQKTTVNLAGLPTGKPLVVNIWAQWCTPCVDETPVIAEGARRWEGKVDFLGVNYSDPVQRKAEDFVVKYGVDFPQVVDAKASLRAPLKVSGLPNTLFVDASGKVVHREVGAITSPDELDELIKEHLGVTA